MTTRQDLKSPRDGKRGGGYDVRLTGWPIYFCLVLDLLLLFVVLSVAFHGTLAGNAVCSALSGRFFIWFDLDLG